MLVPFAVYAGLQVTFIQEAFTAGYIGCTFGVQWVGFVMIFYGSSILHLLLQF